MRVMIQVLVFGRASPKTVFLEGRFIWGEVLQGLDLDLHHSHLRA